MAAIVQQCCSAVYKATSVLIVLQWFDGCHFTAELLHSSMLVCNSSAAGRQLCTLKQ